MSEQENPKSFMQELDAWTELNILAVVSPLIDATRHPWDWEHAFTEVKKAIRTKVLESYRNGQTAGPNKPRSFKPRQ